MAVQVAAVRKEVTAAAVVVVDDVETVAVVAVAS